MLGNTYILKSAERNPWDMMSFHGVPVKLGSAIKVLAVDKFSDHMPLLGATEIEVDGVKYEIDPKHPVSWCFFTESMTNDAEYGIHKFDDFSKRVVQENVGGFMSGKLNVESKDKVVHKSAGEVGVSMCETEYLNQGKNGKRLMESVEQIRKSASQVDWRNDNPIASVDTCKKSGKSYLKSYGVKPLEDRYNEWVLENIHFYELFCKFTLQAIESGKKKISHWLIVNRIRWEVEIETKGTCAEDRQYKVSNDYIAFLARDFMKDHPEHGEIFNIKVMKRV